MPDAEFYAQARLWLSQKGLGGNRMDVSVRDIQVVLFDMLCDVDSICRKHGITYQLFAGSALGAVRHKGFIPWDDDLDIAMSRTDYDRFLSVAPQELDPRRYYLQSEFSEHFPMFYTKLRRNNTTYMERYHPRDPQMHQGVFVDIFPIDNLADSPAIAKLQFYLSKIVIAKCLRKRGYETDSLMKKIFMILCAPLPLKPLLKVVQRRKDPGSSRVHSFFGGSSKYAKSVYPRSVLLTSDARFENGHFSVSKSADELLSILYGDYMTLPDEAHRDIKKHYLKVDLHHSYEDYLDWQREQVIDTYTRSIR